MALLRAVLKVLLATAMALTLVLLATAVKLVLVQVLLTLATAHLMHPAVQVSQLQLTACIHCVSEKKRHPFTFVITQSDVVQFSQLFAETYPRKFKTDTYTAHHISFCVRTVPCKNQQRFLLNTVAVLAHATPLFIVQDLLFSSYQCDQCIRGYFQRYALYKSTFYLLTYCSPPNSF